LITLYAWFPPFRCRSVVAVSPFRKFRKNYFAYVKNSVALLPFSPAVARRNRRSVAIGSNPIFLPFWRRRTTNQPGTGHFMYMERRFQHFRSHLQRQRYLRNGRTATEWWKKGIIV